MFPSLRHHRFIGGDHQQRDVDAADARQHIVDEPLMSRHVDDADLAARRQPKPREAQVNGKPALFFFGESVRVDPRQRLDERRLPMINVSRCANYKHCQNRFAASTQFEIPDNAVPSITFSGCK